mmetsp:Transcript_47276/g.147807  ORF Transcript_47276/g.147807 Transcript_47276/m.147807 type:complete len:219 (+) Transcript_47276:407-1063(+)
MIVLAVERSLPAQNHEGDDADAPHVACASIALSSPGVQRRLSAENFGCHVIRGAEDGIHPVGVGEHLAEAEVYQLDVCILLFTLQHQVFQLQVTVSNVSLMAVVNGLHYPLDDPCNSLLREFNLTQRGVVELLAIRKDFNPLQEMPEFSSGAKLHNHEELAVFLEDLIQLDDILVVQRSQHLNFSSQTNKGLRLNSNEVDRFHRILHSCFFVRCHTDC